ncbi:MAG: RNA polymerase sigma factor [Candidatus Aminicenantes bacterium]|nr:RNA polymerase sigma factor [Candidatus Aminicenantes bacterium]
MNPDMPNDDAIITSVLEGRTADFEILIKRYSAKIITFISSMTADRDEARSIAQDVFLKIYQNLPYYKKQNNFSAFIFKIAKNMTLNWLNRQKRTVFFSRLLGREFNQPQFRQAPAQTLDPEAAERDEKINRSLRSLPEDQRIALILKVYLELSYKQIQEISGWSIPKIETLISRAKSRMKKNISLQENNATFVLKARKNEL